MRRHWLLLIVISLALSVSIPLYMGGFESLAKLRQLPFYAIALLIGMVFLGWLANAGRIWLLVTTLDHRIRWRTAITSVVSAEFAGLATPVATGAGATYMFLLSRHGVPVGRTAGLMAIDFMMEIVFFATTLPVAAIIFSLESPVSRPLNLGVLVIVLLAAGAGLLAVLIRYYRPLALKVGQLMHHVPRLRRVRFRLARLLIQFRHSIQMLIRMGWRRLLLLYLLVVSHYLVRYSLLPIILWFLDEAVPWGYLFIVQTVILFLGQATFLPGGGGGVEIGFTALLTPYLDRSTIATALLGWRFLTFYWYLMFGGVIFLLTTGRHARELIAARSA